MDKAKGCYVSMPFGRKLHSDGIRLVDFDRIYVEAIRPTVNKAALECVRGDDFLGGSLILKPIFEWIMKAEVMIADVTSNNPNVMYELGIRHATTPRPTIVIASSDTKVPYNVSFIRTLRYDLDTEGRLIGDAAEDFRTRLYTAIDDSMRAPAVFSPLFELFPEALARVPEEFGGPPTSAAAPTVSEADPLGRRLTKHTSLKAAEERVVQQPEVDPTAMLRILKGYQEVSAWDDLVRFADTLPEELQQNPEVAQRVALALNRRAQPGDRDRAVEMLSKLIERTGGDGESYGILGRIYKDLFRESKKEEYWVKAYDAYRKGFELQPDNYYPGVNAVTLLVERGTPQSARELKQLLPRVKQALEQRIATKPADYWDLATGMHLAAVGRDWSGAKTYAEQILKSTPSPWMLATTVNDLKALAPGMAEPDRNRLGRLLQPIEARIGAENA